MQNDGYITGTSVGEVPTSGNNGYVAMLIIDDEIHVISSTNDIWYKTNIYVPAGKVVKTRSDHGQYNLTVYEWK